MPVGRVKWWNDDAGYGFIISPGGIDVFVHHATLQFDGYRSLTEGQRVEYEEEEGPHGPIATQVREPGQPIRPHPEDRDRAGHNGVRSFTGDSLREIEHAINEWIATEGVIVLSVSVVQTPKKPLGALVVYLRRGSR